MSAMKKSTLSSTRQSVARESLSKTLSEFPTNTLKKVYVKYDPQTKRFTEDAAVTKIKHKIFE